MSDWIEKKVEGVRLPQHEYRAIKYCSGKAGKFLGDLVGRAMIPAVAAYAAHKLGVPHEYLMLAPGLLLIPPVFRAGRKLGNLCSRIGAFIGKQIPHDYHKGTVTQYVGNNPEKYMEKMGKDYLEAGFDSFKYRRIEDYVEGSG